jgi:oxalate decarboxylase/phosphoglucose isomerase-like protein (cupin superfamily)
VSLDGAEHVVDAGASVFIPGDSEHGIRNTGSAPLRVAYVLAADSLADVDYRFSVEESTGPDADIREGLRPRPG